MVNVLHKDVEVNGKRNGAERYEAAGYYSTIPVRAADNIYNEEVVLPYKVRKGKGAEHLSRETTAVDLESKLRTTRPRDLAPDDDGDDDEIVEMEKARIDASACVPVYLDLVEGDSSFHCSDTWFNSLAPWRFEGDFK